MTDDPTPTGPIDLNPDGFPWSCPLCNEWAGDQGVESTQAAADAAEFRHILTTHADFIADLDAARGLEFKIICYCAPVRSLTVTAGTFHDAPIVCGKCGHAFSYATDRVSNADYRHTDGLHPLAPLLADVWLQGVNTTLDATGQRLRDYTGQPIINPYTLKPLTES